MITALTISLMILFLHSCTWDGMIFSSISKVIKQDEGRWLWKPIYGCPICMTPWWGSLIYWLFFHVSIADWLLSVGCAGGLSVLFVAALHWMDN